jgi:hypothetical protein|tara:strand:- start:86 stop:778 length:693 start_codon:yes stop_codon:yes gene_type:complete
MSKYKDFLKSWQTDNKMTSFFGSDKREFLDDWQRLKSTNVVKKIESPNVAIEPMEIAEPPKPKRTAAETVLTNPDLLKQIGSFTNAGKKVNAVKIKLTPNTDKEELTTFLTKKYYSDYLKSPLTRGNKIEAYTVFADKITDGLNKWIALDGDDERISKRSKKLKDYEYFNTRNFKYGLDDKYDGVEVWGVDETALKHIKSAEKKGLISVEYKFFKKLADLYGYEIKRPKQ